MFAAEAGQAESTTLRETAPSHRLTELVLKGSEFRREQGWEQLRISQKGQKWGSRLDRQGSTRLAMIPNEFERIIGLGLLLAKLPTTQSCS